MSHSPPVSNDIARRRLAILSAAIILASCAMAPTDFGGSEQPPLFSAPIDLDSEGRPVVAVMIEDKGPFNFVLDTASTRTAVSWSVLESLGRPVTPQSSVRILGISGAAVAPTATIHSISLGGRRFEDIRIVIIDDWRSRSAQPEGIIGLDILDSYFLMVDPSARVAEFYNRDGPPAKIASQWNQAPLTRIPFEENAREGLSGRVYAVEGKVNFTPAPMLIDTGSSASVANRAFLETVQLLKPTIPRRTVDASAAGTQAVQGVSGESAEVFELIVYGIAAGDVRWRDRSIFILDAPIFGDLGFQNRPMAIVGYDILSERAFALDFKGEALFVEPQQ